MRLHGKLSPKHFKCKLTQSLYNGYLKYDGGFYPEFKKKKSAMGFYSTPLQSNTV